MKSCHFSPSSSMQSIQRQVLGIGKVWYLKVVPATTLLSQAVEKNVVEAIESRKDGKKDRAH